MGAEDLPWLELDDLAALRAWLAEHHQRQQGVWLVTPRRAPGRPHLPYGDIVDELLCFGWIDSQPRKVDDHRTRLLITPRRAGSGWSAVNKAKIARLTETGRMTEAGAAKIRAAIADGSWTRIDEAGDLSEPPDLSAALDARPEARRCWDRFPPSSRRAILEWILVAKGADTRARRVANTVEKAAENLKANFPAGRDRGPAPG